LWRSSPCKTHPTASWFISPHTEISFEGSDFGDGTVEYIYVERSPEAAKEAIERRGARSSSPGSTDPYVIRAAKAVKFIKAELPGTAEIGDPHQETVPRFEFLNAYLVDNTSRDAGGAADAKDLEVFSLCIEWLNSSSNIVDADGKPMLGAWSQTREHAVLLPSELDDPVKFEAGEWTVNEGLWKDRCQGQIARRFITSEVVKEVGLKVVPHDSRERYE
jgi:hypothetical protein